MTDINEPIKENALVIIRTFNADRIQVWEAWTDPQMTMKWWGPEGFTCPSSTMDFRVGGTYLNCMRSPDGKDFWSTGTYKEIVPEVEFVCSDSFSDPDGNIVPASYYGMEADFPLECTISVALEDEEGGKTKMTLTHSGIPESVMKDCESGWSTSFDKLEELLEK